MKTHGYYFCDQCDDNACGAVCLACHQPARLVADSAPRAAAPKTAALAKPKSTFNRVDRAAWWFAEMRRIVASAPDQKP